MKHCSNKLCKEKNPQSLDGFYKQSSSRGGNRAECISCTKKYYIDNKEKINKRQKEYNKNPQVELKDRKRHFLKKYGLSLERYNEMMINQNHKCKICEIDEVNARFKRSSCRPQP